MPLARGNPRSLTGYGHHFQRFRPVPPAQNGKNKSKRFQIIIYAERRNGDHPRAQKAALTRPRSLPSAGLEETGKTKGKDTGPRPPRARTYLPTPRPPSPRTGEATRTTPPAPHEFRGARTGLRGILPLTRRPAQKGNPP